MEQDEKRYESFGFEIGKDALATQTVPAIIGFYHHQRGELTGGLKVDEHLVLYGSTNTVDLRGGWCDASGDVSKYFSHLAYANSCRRSKPRWSFGPWSTRWIRRRRCSMGWRQKRRC